MSEPICPDCGYFGSSSHTCDETNSPHAKIIDFPKASRYAEPHIVAAPTDSHPVKAATAPGAPTTPVETQTSGAATPSPDPVNEMAKALASLTLICDLLTNRLIDLHKEIETIKEQMQRGIAYAPLLGDVT